MVRVRVRARARVRVRIRARVRVRIRVRARYRVHPEHSLTPNQGGGAHLDGVRGAVDGSECAAPWH